MASCPSMLICIASRRNVSPSAIETKIASCVFDGYRSFSSSRFSSAAIPSTSVLISWTCSSRLRISALPGSSARAIPAIETKNEIAATPPDVVSSRHLRAPSLCRECGAVSASSHALACELTRKTDGEIVIVVVWRQGLRGTKNARSPNNDVSHVAVSRRAAGGARALGGAIDRKCRGVATAPERSACRAIGRAFV